MNRLKHILSVLSIVLFASCADEVDTENYFLSSGYLTVDKTSITLEGTADDASIAVKANCHWTITGLADWLTVSQQSGDNSQTITLSATRNSSITTDRNATIVFQTDDGLKRPVTVRQSRLVESLSLSISDLQLATAGEQKTFVVQSNTAWTIMGSEPWFSLSSTAGEGNQEITVTALPNAVEDDRSATLTVHGTDRSATITLRQTGIEVNLTATPLSLSFDAKSQSKAVQLSGTANWTITSSAEWAAVDRLAGTGAGAINVTCADNMQTVSRSATVTITWKGGKFDCQLTQAAATLPQLGSTTISNIARYSTTVSSTVTSLYPVTASGFCYSTTHSTPTLDDQTVAVAPNSQGTMTATLSDLQSHAHYYVCSYATSAVGTAYGPVQEFTTVGGVPGEDDNIKPNL